MHVDTGAAARGHLREGRCEAGCAEILQRDDVAALDELEAGFDQLLAGERITDLDGRSLVGVLIGELLTREHARPADAVAAGRRAVQDDEVAGTARLRRRDAIGREQPDAHRVDEAVVAIGRIEDALAPHVRDTDAVAVVADARDGVGEQPALVGLGEVTEADRVEQRDRPRAHRDDVAEDPTDTSRGALEGFDRRGVVVALDLEGKREPAPHVDDAGVLAGSLQHVLPIGRKAAQQAGRVLVAAVLRPQQREDRELEVVWRALEPRLDRLELVVGQPERSMEWLLERGGQPRRFDW